MANTIRKNDELNNKHVKYHKKKWQTERDTEELLAEELWLNTIVAPPLTNNYKPKKIISIQQQKNITALQCVFRTKLIG